MRFSTIICLLGLASVSWAGPSPQSCNMNPTPPIPSSVDYSYPAAFVKSISPANDSGLTCRLEACNGASPSGYEYMLADNNITSISSQYCADFNATLLGCEPNQYILDTKMVGNWYYKGCKHCQSTCNAANLVGWIGSNRNPGALMVVEFSNAGRTCYLMQCITTGCFVNNNITQYAYTRTSSVPSFYFPTPGNQWTTTQRSYWSEFDVPTSYTCGDLSSKTYAAQSTSLCDRTIGGSNMTYWVGARSWEYNTATRNCEIKQCAGNNAMNVAFTSANINGAGALNPEFAHFIRTNCQTELQGCLSDETMWKYTNTSANDCSAANFCNMLSCSCTAGAAAGADQYTIDTVLSTQTGSGVVLPVRSQSCIKAKCNTMTASLYPNGVNNSQADFTRWIDMAAKGSCATTQTVVGEYYTSSINAPFRGTLRAGVPMAWRSSDNPNVVTYGTTQELFCSALGYGASYPLTTNPGTCYRSPYYVYRTYGLGLTSYSSSIYCQDLGTSASDGGYDWYQTSGAGCGSLSTTFPISAPTCAPSTRQTQSTSSSYKYTSSGGVDKRWIDVQCYPSKQNFVMADQCTQISSPRIQEKFRSTRHSIAKCYSQIEIIGAYTLGVSCVRSTTRAMSHVDPPRYKTEQLMQENKCDAFRFRNLLQKMADCECSYLSNVYSGGSANYLDQVYEQFRANWNTRTTSTYSGVGSQITRLNNLGCTYRISCDPTSFAASVKVYRPKFMADYIINTPCKRVDWSQFRINLRNVFERTDIGGTVFGNGRFGGVQIDAGNAKDLAGNLCQVALWSYFRSPEKAKWFNGNLTDTTNSKLPLPMSVNGGPGLLNNILIDDDASNARTLASLGVRRMPSVMLVFVLAVVCIFR